jgi:hypothetical protein
MGPDYRYVDRYAGGTVDAGGHLAVIADVHDPRLTRPIFMSACAAATNEGSDDDEKTWRR